MPCMGPEVNQQEVEQAYQEILALLKEKYKIQDRPPLFGGLNMCGFITRNMIRGRERANAGLRTALEKLFLNQACEDF